MDTPGALATGVYSAFVADADLLAALGGTEERMYHKRAPEKEPHPYCVYTIFAFTPFDTLTENGELLQLQFNIYDYDEDSPDDDSTINDVYSKLDELYNKGSLTVSGYHHNYTLRQMVNSIPTLDDTQQITVTYEVMLQEN